MALKMPMIRRSTMIMAALASLACGLAALAVTLVWGRDVGLSALLLLSAAYGVWLYRKGWPWAAALAAALAVAAFSFPVMLLSGFVFVRYLFRI